MSAQPPGPDGPPPIYAEPRPWPDPRQQRPGGEGPEARVPWSAMDVAAIIGLVLAAFVVVGGAFAAVLVAVGVLYPDFDLLDKLTSPVANTLSWLVQTVITLGVAIIYLKLRGYRLNLKILGFRRTPFWTATAMVFGILMAFFAFQALYVQIIEPRQPEVTEIFGDSLWSLLLSIVIVSILTPFSEELFFRGIVHQGLEHRFGFLPAALLSSAVFALAHIDPTLFIPIFAIGFGFAFLMSKTQSIWPSIAGHFILNTVGVLAQFLYPGV